METDPVATPGPQARRPGLVAAIAALACIGGLVYIGIVVGTGASLLLGEMFEPVMTVPAGALLALGVVRLLTARGLLRMQRWARLAEIIVCWMWIALLVTASGVAFLGDWTPLIVTVPLGLVSIAKVIYLGKRTVKPLFGAPIQEPPVERTTRRLGSRLALGAAAVVVIFLAATMSSSLFSAATSGRNPQKRTMSEMRAISTALEAYSTDNNAYPPGSTLDEVARFLEPTYIRTLPRTDGWKGEIRYAHRVTAAGPSYRLASAGKGRKWEQTDLYSYAPGETDSIDSDIVLENGTFIRYPRGAANQ